MLLEVKEINTFYGISHILFNVSLEIDKGEVVCILGRNGVGKTTLLRSIMGLTSARSGKILFGGVDIRGKQPFEVARLGVGFVPEDRVIFPALTVSENLEMGTKRGGMGPWTFERVFEMFPILDTRRAQMGGTLSGGEQQMLTIGRTLMGNPELLLLDEPSEGLAPLVVEALAEQIRKLMEEDITILLSEMGLGFAVELSNQAFVIDKGENKWSGTPDRLLENEDLKSKYLAL